MDTKEVRLAKEAYDSCCRVLDAKGWKYHKDDEELYIALSVTGEDLPMSFSIVCNVEYQIISLQSTLPFKMSEEKRIEGSIATNSINYCLADGSFDYNLADGTILFRMTSSFRSSLIHDEVFNYMINVACSTIDEYNDKLLMLSKGQITLADILK